MCWRQVSKLQRSVLILLFYITVYLLISYAITPEATVTFVSDDIRVGDKYVFLFLVAPKTPVFSDADGASVVEARCGKCFITNNRGFLPLKEYDGILILGDGSLLSEASDFMEAEKKYLIETTDECVRGKLRGCIEEPKITCFETRNIYDLCGLCQDLHRKRRPNE